MPFVYHRVPNSPVGDAIYPLNRLKQTQPALYEQQVRKYEGREWLLERRVDLLDCLWNDVVHTSPVHPQQVYEALMQAGWDKRFPASWYRIDVAALGFSADNTVIYHSGSQPSEARFEPFTVEKLAAMTAMPDATLAYYQEQIAIGKQPLLFHCVPHILHCGALPIAALELIELDITS
jgi:hypothetical protein